MNFFNQRTELIKGVAIGVGVCVVGYVAYKKNEDAVNSFLNNHGFNIESGNNTDFYSMSLEKLMETKETIEDIIAEKDLNGVTIVSTEA
ncbi:hypothetical protein [Peptostreptococcus sp. D1]|uniref:hypothetical protein n=1 Tax=Peptostreptococcus sp. D1 TaxID=72304 RepID=UPI0008EC14BA|nr:hypothetical protein [Peptostreptococcus sp. D1]SFE23551.1 hypothetical protein SAMN02910278_00365 [Peptostreptococcus sp. D1]